MNTRQKKALAEVIAERVRQDAKFGDQSGLPDGTGTPEDIAVADYKKKLNNMLAEGGVISWCDILHEEMLEVAAEKDPAKLREELVQVAAVAVAWIEALDLRDACAETVRSPGGEA